MNYLRMDLKVCEGCGALWLRSNVADGVYCKTCSARLADFPAPRQRRSPSKHRRGSRSVGCAAATRITGGSR